MPVSTGFSLSQSVCASAREFDRGDGESGNHAGFKWRDFAAHQTGFTTQRPLRILVADDNHINQKVAASLLENFGHRADVVANGHEAIEAYKLVPYDMFDGRADAGIGWL